MAHRTKINGYAATVFTRSEYLELQHEAYARMIEEDKAEERAEAEARASGVEVVDMSAELEKDNVAAERVAQYGARRRHFVCNTELETTPEGLYCRTCGIIVGRGS